MPSWTSRVGDGRGEYAKDKAGWGWTSQESNADIREILANFLELFSPHQGLLQQSVESGAEVTLSVSGVIEVGIVDIPEEADRRQYEMPEPFVPSRTQIDLRFSSTQRPSDFSRRYRHRFRPTSTLSWRGRSQTADTSPAYGGTRGPDRIPLTHAGLFGALGTQRVVDHPGSPAEALTAIVATVKRRGGRTEALGETEAVLLLGSRSAYRMLGMVSPVKTRPIRLHVVATLDSHDTVRIAADAASDVGGYLVNVTSLSSRQFKKAFDQLFAALRLAAPEAPD